MPFGNTIDIVELLGKDLIEVLEFSVANYSTKSRHGKFLQVSGKQSIDKSYSALVRYSFTGLSGGITKLK